jgi:hypothetical protein
VIELTIDLNGGRIRKLGLFMVLAGILLMAFALGGILTILMMDSESGANECATLAAARKGE